MTISIAVRALSTNITRSLFGQTGPDIAPVLNKRSFPNGMSQLGPISVLRKRNAADNLQHGYLHTNLSRQEFSVQTAVATTIESYSAGVVLLPQFRDRELQRPRPRVG